MDIVLTPSKVFKTGRLFECFAIHTYIIGHYNPAARIIDLISHTTYVLCFNFIHKWRLRTTDFFEKLFMAILFILRIFARNLLRGNRRRNTFRISFWCLTGDSNPGFSFNKPTHHLLDHGDFILGNIIVNLSFETLEMSKPSWVEPIKIFVANLQSENMCVLS